MDEIPSPPKRGCGQLSYGEVYFSCVEHRRDSHPMFVDAWSFTCENVHDHPMGELFVIINLVVEGSRFGESGV